MGTVRTVLSRGKAPAVLAASAAALGVLLSYRSQAGVAAVQPAPRSTAPSKAHVRTAIGESAYSPNGPVKVEIWEVGTHITDVEALTLPNDNAHSIELSNYSGPKLRKEALTAQSAHIHGVSGATMTSSAYEQSLQSAIERIHNEGSVSVIGTTEQTTYGPVEVEVDLEDGHISAVRALELPEDGSLAAALSNYAAPMLAREAVAKGSAKIDGVSGATMTSAAYRRSLSSALRAWKADS